jgi:hypothetical protein
MRNFLAAVAVSACSISSWADALLYSNMTTADALAQTLVGSGIVISNINYYGAPEAAGTYTNAIPALTQGQNMLENGLIISSGYASHLTSSINTAPNVTGRNGGGDDPDLELLIPGYQTTDACALEFDFYAEGAANDVVTSSFWYIFGSDEYEEFVFEDYNDVFGFFLDGNNIALIPGTSTPVSINNINFAINPEYYNDNVSPRFETEMDGFTKPLYVEFQIPANETHHIKLAIADAGDDLYDSWIMLGAGSFKNSPISDVPEPASAALIVLGMLAVATFRRTKK